MEVKKDKIPHPSSALLRQCALFVDGFPVHTGQVLL